VQVALFFICVLNYFSQDSEVLIVKKHKVKFQDNVMLPHAWTDDVGVTITRSLSLDGDRIMFEEWDQVGSSKFFVIFLLQVCSKNYDFTYLYLYFSQSIFVEQRGLQN
jgi:membrane-bound acyltransferase YfiQ involved in biofilm formation